MVSTPDGVIHCMYGPEVGRRNDLTLLRNNGLEEELSKSLLINGRHFYIFGEAAYVLRPYMQCPWSTVVASDNEKAFNRAMNGLCVNVEWLYKEFKHYWTLNDFAGYLKARRAPIALMFKASGLFLNMRVCIDKGAKRPAILTIMYLVHLITSLVSKLGICFQPNRGERFALLKVS